jgi:protein ImuB
MPRVASLYLPNFATDRLRRIDARHDGTKPIAKIAAALQAIDATIERASECSAPRGGGWRPGARWASNSGPGSAQAARRGEVQAEIDALPVHQRPPVRELGRRSEAVAHPFRGLKGDDGRGGALVPRPLPAKADANPEVAPLVTVHRQGQRIAVAAACPIARALGLVPGMAVTQARALVPGLDVRDVDPGGEHHDLTRLAQHGARHWSPGVAAVADGLWLDLTGVAHLFGGEAALCRRILRFLARLGFAGRIAVAGTPGAAYALARHVPQPITLCPSGREAEAIADLPLAGLRIEEGLLDRLRRLGIDRVADLAGLPRAPLVRRFGELPVTRLDQALGRMPEPIETVVPTTAPCAMLRFAEPLASADPIGRAIEMLVTSLVDALQARGLGARRVVLVCRRVDGIDQLVRIGTARPTRDAPHLVRLLLPKIETIDPGFGIEAMRLTAAQADPLEAQAIAGDLAGAPAVPDLSLLIDTLAVRLGARRLYRLAAVESDVPERSVRRADPLGGAGGWRRDWPRPARIFSPAHPVQVMALLPDGVPRRFVWRDRQHQIVRGDGPERIYGEWWQAMSEADAVRDYYQVEDEAGHRFWLYRRGDGTDARTGDHSWHLQGVFR